MAKLTRRTAIVAVIALLMAGLSAATGTTSASGQAEPTGHVAITEAEYDGTNEAAVPAPVDGVLVHEGFEGTATGPTNPENNGGVEGIPLGDESIIGADGRVQEFNTTNYPERTIGQIVLNQNGTIYTCTGWLIDPNSLLTSGHCAYNPTPTGGDIIEWANFYPGRNGASDPYGGYSVYNVYAPSEWRYGPDSTDEYADFAVMSLTLNAGNTVGWLGYFARNAQNALLGLGALVEGYPGDKPPGTRWYMSGRIGASQRKMTFYRMDTYGGQSGSPVYQYSSPYCGGDPCGMAIHSYGVHGFSAHSNYNHGPRITIPRFGLIQSIAAAN